MVQSLVYIIRVCVSKYITWKKQIPIHITDIMNKWKKWQIEAVSSELIFF